MYEFNDVVSPTLSIDSWRIREKDAWCVLTHIGSGEQQLIDLLQSEFDRCHQESRSSSKVAKIISFRSLQTTYELELKLDNSDYTNEMDSGTLVKELLPKKQLHSPLIDLLDLRTTLETGLRQLSTGENRKVAILKALLEGAETMVCENPFDGLDQHSCTIISKALETANHNGCTVILILNNTTDIPDWCTKFASVKNGYFKSLAKYQLKEQIETLDLNLEENKNLPSLNYNFKPDYNFDYLFELNNCTVSLQGKDILSNITFKLKPLEHCLVVGRNGVGKSTLLKLITGECPQCFSNDVTVFGFKRGSGESIWDIKRHMGIVSSELHRSYRVRCKTVTAIASGFHDSIGIYKPLTNSQLSLSKEWLKVLGLERHFNTMFHELSYGEQRLILIARALIKSPLLLIMDEPTQGLDEYYRNKVLNFLTFLARSRKTTILYVSHRQDEYIDWFQQVKRLP